MTTSGSRRRRGSSGGAFTLLEILMAIGLVAVLAAITVPLIGGAIGRSDGEEIERSFETVAASARRAALSTGEARRVQVTRSGLSADGESAPLREGWKLEMMRLTDSRWRAPGKNEAWEFNAAGICEPLAFRLTGPDEMVVIRFDALTAQILRDE